MLKELGVLEDNFFTLPEMQHVFYEKRFEELGCFISSKGDRELYVRPIFVTMQALTKRRLELTNEAQTVINSFRVEEESSGKYWDVALWVIKPV